MLAAQNIKCGIYEAFNEKNELIARGFKDDVAMVIGCDPHYVSTYARSRCLYKSKFRIEKVKDERRDVEYEFEPCLEKNEEKEIPDYILVNVNKYGNCILPDGNPNVYIEYLKTKGYKCKARKGKTVNKKGVIEEFYVAEVV